MQLYINIFTSIASIFIKELFRYLTFERKRAHFKSRKKQLTRRLLPFKRLILNIEHVCYLS